MRKQLAALLRHDGGMQVAEWVGVMAVVLCMIMALWGVFYGAPGRTLRATVGAQVSRYAGGFEGNLETSGPRGGRGNIGNPDTNCDQLSLDCALDAISAFFSDARTQGSLIGMIGAGLALLAAGALGVLAGLPTLAIVVVVGAALAVGALAGYTYAERTGRADLVPILLLGFAGGGLAILVGVSLLGAGGLAVVLTNAVLGGAIDYGVQVFLNYQRGLRGWNAWVGQINWQQTGTSALFGGIAGGVGAKLGPVLGSWFGGSVGATIAGGVLGGGLSALAGQVVVNIVTGQPLGKGLAEMGLLGSVFGGVGAAIGRGVLGLARAITGQRMVGAVRPPGATEDIVFQSLSGWSQGVIRQLERRGWVRVAHVPLNDLTDVSMFFGREIGVVQSSLDGRLRLVLGDTYGITRGQTRPGEVFVAHTHPVFRSLADHFGTDLPNAGKHTEMVIDWSGLIVYFNKNGLLNPILHQMGQKVIQPHPTFQPSFIRDGKIVGYPHIRPFFDRLGKLLHIKVTP